MRKRKHSSSVYWPVVIGVVQALLLSVLTAALGAVLIDNESIQVGAIPVIAAVAWFVSSFLCTIFASFSGEGSWVLRGGIATGIYYIIMMGVGILVFDGLSGNVLYGIIAGLLGFVLAILILLKKQKKPINRKMRNLKMK